MVNVREVAAQYGVTPGFVILALEKIGCHVATPDSALSAAAVNRFEDSFGDKVRAARPTPPPALTNEDCDAPSVAAPRSARQLKLHVMRIAHDRVGAGRDAQGNREKRLLADPGVIHAMDLVGTWDGDPWNGNVVPGAVHFFGGPMNSGPSAACGRAHMRAVLGDEFVPADDPGGARQCSKCANLVAEGKGFWSPPGSYDPFCHAYLHVKIDGQVEVQDCFLRGEHRGPHRTRDGATWDIGFDDFVPAPLDASHRIADAS